MIPVKIWRVVIENIVYHKCDCCAKAFLNVDDLTTHKKNHEERFLEHLEKIEDQKCNPCSNAFLNVENLTTHEKNYEERFLEHVSSCYVRIEKFKLSDQKYVDKKTNKGSPLLHRLKHIHHSVRHTRQINTRLYEDDSTEKPYKCEQCNFRFVAKSTLNAHLFVHKPFQHICYCGVGFYQLEDLKAHKNLMQCVKPQIKNIESPHNIPKVKPPAKTELIIKKKRIRGMPQLVMDIIQRQKSDSGNARIDKKQSKVQTLAITSIRQRPKFSNLDVEFLKTMNKRFVCPECKKEYQSIYGAQMHYRYVHKGERPYPCKICGKQFTQYGALKLHLEKHLGVKKFTCQYCDRGFYELSKLKLHERTHTGYKPHKCDICGQEFSDPSAFQRHMRIHTEDKKYKCPYCPNAYTDNSQLYIHRKRHENAKNFICNLCKNGFYTKSCLRIHISHVHNYGHNFTCEYCGKALHSEKSMLSHIRKLHNSSRKTYNCPLCFKRLLEPEYLKRHLKVIHKREKIFVCEHCFLVFDTHSQLQNHIVEHSKEQQFECDQCGSHFGAKSDFHKHMLQHHSSIRCDHCLLHFRCTTELQEHVLNVAERCDICDGEFFCKRSMQTHFRTHAKTDSAKFVCEHCGIECSTKNGILHHIAHHHGPRKFVCDHCKQKFSQKYAIRNHMMTYHLDTLRCNICYKGFISSIDLNKHKNIGCTAEKYTCDVCNKTLTTLSGFKSHKRQHTANNGKCNCPMCGVKPFNKTSTVRHIRHVNGKPRKK